MCSILTKMENGETLKNKGMLKRRVGAKYHDKIKTVMAVDIHILEVLQVCLRSGIWMYLLSLF